MRKGHRRLFGRFLKKKKKKKGKNGFYNLLQESNCPFICERVDVTPCDEEKLLCRLFIPSFLLLCQIALLW